MNERVGATLRAKYLDWCSARIAERFLSLDPEEIYRLARPGEASGAGLSSSGDPAPVGKLAEASESYRVLVQRVTGALLEEMSLPRFEEWSREYAADPSRFEGELLGFWKDPSGGGPKSA